MKLKTGLFFVSLVFLIGSFWFLYMENQIIKLEEITLEWGIYDIQSFNFLSLEFHLYQIAFIVFICMYWVFFILSKSVDGNKRRPE